MTLLFCVAAGPRLGYGHLVRAAALARWLRTPCHVVLRGGARATRVARQFGIELIDGPVSRAVSARAWDGVILDEPHGTSAARAVRAARRAGLVVASVHDLCLAPVASDCAVDGSIVASDDLPSGRILAGPRFMILDPRLRSLRRTARRASRVVISLGGGASAHAAVALAEELWRAQPTLEVVVTAPLAGAGTKPRAWPGGRASVAGVHRVDAGPRLHELLASAAVAVTSAGVTLYEASALATPVVPVAVVRAQVPTARAFVERGLVVASRSHSAMTANWRRGVVEDVLRALGDPPWAHRVSRRALHVIDGQGGGRVARELRVLFGPPGVPSGPRP